MEDSHPGSLRQRQDRATTLSGNRLEFHDHRGLLGPHNASEFASRLYAWEALNPQPRPARVTGPAEPYTLQWFLDIEAQRHGRQGRWIPRLLEFAKHPGETLLCLGNGLGTDWLQYARNQANVVVCSSSEEQLTLIRRNFELRSLPGRFLHATPAVLPLEGASIDVACVCNLLHEITQPTTVVDEIYRVLKPGGKVLALTPARFDINCLLAAWLPWQRNLAAAQPPGLDGEGTRYTTRGLRQLFNRFVEHRVYKRQLRRAEVPHLWRWVPLPVLERLLGHFLVLKAFKPVSAAIHAPHAA